MNETEKYDELKTRNVNMVNEFERYSSVEIICLQ